ncbi:MAG TPA: hypothetical protein VHD87_15075 [Acidimicrobiales bacterium]|nr:hypothetical protein [Acidimicrobiales bacterium]
MSATDQQPETIYAVRRCDREPIDDYSFWVTTGPQDWGPAGDSDDAEVVEYELIKLTVERVGVRTVGQPVCDQWLGPVTPPSVRWEVVIAGADDDHPGWPARDYRLGPADSAADAELRVAMLPERVVVLTGFDAHEVSRSRLRIDRIDLPAIYGTCVICGNHYYAHEEAPC